MPTVAMASDEIHAPIVVCRGSGRWERSMNMLGMARRSVPTISTP